ncbi:MAG: hypothetical protein A4E66_02053 [Syntrophus sp. PtaB.Bin001]|nr:MAG: hypothetical protein A4E66_02053 [Syntrophus sp. PtaB.Bin001]
MPDIAAVFIDGENLITASRSPFISNFTTSGRPGRGSVVITGISQSTGLPAIGIHHINLRRSGNVGDKSDLFPVRRPDGRHIDCRIVGQAAQLPAAHIHDIYLLIPVLAQGQKQPPAIRRPGAGKVKSLETGYLF